MKGRTPRAATDRRVRIGVLASGDGSNFQAVADAAREGRLGDATVEVLVCDRPGARVLERAARAGVPGELLDPAHASARAEVDAEVLRVLEAWDVDLVVLAGWMRILGPDVVGAYRGRMLNVHPSLLPSFPGRHAIRQALAHGVKITGVTVHLVDEGVDTGPILAQAAVDVLPGDTEDALVARLHPVEHRLLCATIADLVGGRVAWREDGVPERLPPEAQS